MTQALAILNKLTLVERDLQELKLAVYATLPKSQRRLSTYTEQTIIKASQTVRDDIWQRTYAKQIKSLS